MRTALVALGIAAALVASGSATVAQARAAGMAAIPAVALVVLLEVINVAGTWTWMVDDRTHVQWEAGVGVGVASVVTGACGLASYGPIGLVPAVGVLFTVHLVGRLSHRSTSVKTSTTVDRKPVDPVPPLVDKEAAARFAGLREASRIEWPPPHVEPAEAIHVAGYAPRPPQADPETVESLVESPVKWSTAVDRVVVDEPFVEPCPTEPLDRAEDGRVLDVIDGDAAAPVLEPEPETEPEAATRLIAEGVGTGRPLAEALVALGFPEKGARYRAKKYLGHSTRRMEAAG